METIHSTDPYPIKDQWRASLESRKKTPTHSEAFIYRSPRGEIYQVNGSLSFSEVFNGGDLFVVDRAERACKTDYVDVRSGDSDYVFHITIDLSCRVKFPVQVVQEDIHDIGAYLSRHLRSTVTSLARSRSIVERERLEKEITDAVESDDKSPFEFSNIEVKAEIPDAAQTLIRKYRQSRSLSFDFDGVACSNPEDRCAINIHLVCKVADECMSSALKEEITEFDSYLSPFLRATIETVVGRSRLTASATIAADIKAAIESHATTPFRFTNIHVSLTVPGEAREVIELLQAGRPLTLEFDNIPSNNGTGTFPVQINLYFQLSDPDFTFSQGIQGLTQYFRPLVEDVIRRTARSYDLAKWKQVDEALKRAVSQRLERLDKVLVTDVSVHVGIPKTLEQEQNIRDKDHIQSLEAKLEQARQMKEIEAMEEQMQRPLGLLAGHLAGNPGDRLVIQERLEQMGREKIKAHIDLLRVLAAEGRLEEHDVMEHFRRWLLEATPFAGQIGVPEMISGKGPEVSPPALPQPSRDESFIDASFSQETAPEANTQTDVSWSPEPKTTTPFDTPDASPDV